MANLDFDTQAIEEAPHKKKKNQNSKSSRRSDHKHQYEDAIINSFFGWHWGKTCSVCGRVQTGKFCLSDDEFRKPEFQGSRVFGRDVFLSLEEVKEKYKDVPIFVMDKETWEYKRI